MPAFPCSFVTLSLILCCAAALAGCAGALRPFPSPPATEIANPASVNCVRQGGTLEIVRGDDGGEVGICRFPDNRECEEWALFRGECIPDSRDYHDPFAYCRAVGTVDAPDRRYRGERVPDSVVREMVRLGLVAADAPPAFRREAVWRCLDGTVRVCHFGANIPCLEKADSSRTPSRAMEDYCRANPEAEAIPASVTGRATVYTWSCGNGTPRAVRRLFRNDRRGFLVDFWHELTPGKGQEPPPPGR